MNPTPNFSLLYPSTADPSIRYTWGSNTITDLDLDKIASAAYIGQQYRETIHRMLLNVSADPQVIVYRQQVLTDFMTVDGIAAGFEELLPILARLHDSLTLPPTRGDEGLKEAVGRLAELNTYVTCVNRLQAILSAPGAALSSQALCNLRDQLKEIAAEETFQSLAQTLPGLLTQLRTVPSITIGVNLDGEWRPVEATLLSINEKPFKGGSFLQQLMNKKVSEKADEGIAPLHTVPFVKASDGVRTINTALRADPIMIPLFRDLFKLLKSIVRPISAALKQYAKVNANFLVALEEETAFYLGAVNLIRKMEAVGLPMCRPEVLPNEARACKIKDLYNLRLALDMQHSSPDLRGVVVQNDVDFGPDGRIFILTGPNQGGKTVHTQAVGIAQVLLQAGLYVPAPSAKMSPVDGLYTHFAIEEKSIQGMGRLSEESKRLSDIFETITPGSMVLLNESLSSTSASESLYMAQDIVRALRLFGVRAMYATHLHELAESVDVMNREVSGDSLIVSLVAEVDLQAEAKDELIPRTYKIKPGPPTGHSYAKGIAMRYGVSFEQLAGKWQERSRK